MASLALRNKCKTLNLKPHQNLVAFSHHYSSSSSNNDNDGNVPPKPSSFTSYFNQQPETSSTSFRASNYNPQGSKPTSFDEIKKSLSEFRRRTGPETPLPATQKPISFQNRFNKIGGNPNPNPNPSFPKGGALSFEKIKESLKTMRVNGDGQDKRVTGQFSLNNLTESFKTKPSIGNRVINFGNSGNNSGNVGASVNKSWVIGGSLENLPKETFGKEIKEKEAKKNGENDSSQFELIKVYSLAELGMKLKELRPDTTTLVKKTKKGKDGAEEGWFSLSELQQRLGKLKEIEEMESARSGNAGIGDLRRSLVNMKLAKDEKPKNPRFDILSQSSFMVSPPKEHLVEKYFHPDNMSAAEKLKLELKKVRDEFKMSESDCGSTRVQIAQLTTEILHLSSVLHKKDKHSRRGLQAKVQQRKKLLKYLRRTDWDSYCFVLSKLGLRDNPDYKN